MTKIRVHITECSEADVIAEDITNRYGAFVLPSGTIINSYLIQKLAEFGIEYIWILSPKDRNDQRKKDFQLFEKKYEKEVEEMKYIVRELIKGKKINYTTISNLANSIISTSTDPEHIIECLLKIRNTDDYTYYHCVNVSFYAMMIAGWLNLSREDIKTVIQAGLLHDIGKVKISKVLLNKKEKLSAQEFEEIKKHTIYGYELVKDIPQISEEVRDIILMHHEREDKSGYFLRASGADLSIYTKIVAVADVYDAMTSNRSYKTALTPFDAFEEFLTVCGSSLDMNIVNTLINNLSRYYTGSKVLLSNGQTGNIAYIPPHCIWKPIINTDSGFLDLYREKNVYIAAMA